MRAYSIFVKWMTVTKISNEMRRRHEMDKPEAEWDEEDELGNPVNKLEWWFALDVIGQEACGIDTEGCSEGGSPPGRL